jgi:class 3 adenylate cyclase
VSDIGRSVQRLTIMMTDVEGSTALRRTVGDEVADEILEWHAGIVRDQIGKCGGQERQFLGDGFLLSFPSPVAAIWCAVGIEGAHEEHNASDPQRQVRIRIGIHIGEVSERDGQLYGQAVHVAARITAEAVGGQILVSDLVRDQAESEGMWRFVDEGLFWLKGFDERWRLFDVSAGDAATNRSSIGAAPLTPLVGRDSEQADLRRAVNQALAGHGGLAMVGGEAGVGKSRLVAEIGGTAGARGMRVLTGHCVEMDSTPPYLPYVEMIEQVISSPRSPLALREALGDVAAEIARIAPGLRRLFTDIPQPVELPLSSPGVTGGTASINLWPAGRKRSRCCSYSRTCIGPMNPRCCLPSTLHRCCPRCPCSSSAPTETTRSTPRIHSHTLSVSSVGGG